MEKLLRDAVVVAYGRSPVGRANKGSYINVHPVELAAQTLKGVLARVPQLDPMDIDDVIVGCSVTEGIQGGNIGRYISLKAGLPDEVAGQTVNRYCSSGLQAIATAANVIKVGEADVLVAGGVEMMTFEPTELTHAHFVDAELDQMSPGAYMAMGETAENVVDRYHIARADMDALAVESHRKAAEAQASGRFDKEIVPMSLTDFDGNTVTCTKDEGIRPGTNLEKLATLQSPFREHGQVTAGTSSQRSDGSGFVVLMSGEKARALGIKPIARFVGFAVAGVDPTVMGIGPVRAVPKVLKTCQLKLEDMDVIELNEAFASQAIYCMNTLGMDRSRVNPNGGALALGHPLGATGAILSCKLLSELDRTGGKYGMVTMCIGIGMGAAGIWEML